MHADQPDEPDGRLRRLDEALVPAIRRSLRAVLRFLAAPVHGLRRAEDWLFGGAIARFGHRNRRVVTFVTVMVMVGAAAVNYVRYPELRETARQEAAAAREQTVREPGSGVADDVGTLAGGAVAVGPVVGTSVERYLEDAGKDLAALAAAASGTAVVSFDDFVTPGRAGQLVGPDVRADRVQYRLPIEGAVPGSASTGSSTASVREAEVIRGDVEASVASVVEVLLADVVAEESELRSMLETTEEEAFREEFERRLEELAQLRSTLGSGGRIVFAVVVSGTGEDLRGLASQDAVRVVDVAPPGTDDTTSGFFGLLPTDRDEVSFGRPAG